MNKRRHYHYKPYPYVFGKSKVNTGIGLSGPGGLLWPIHPGVSDSLLRRKMHNVPSPIMIPGITFTTDAAYIGDEFEAHFSFVFNMQRLITSIQWDKTLEPFAEHFISYIGSKLVEPHIPNEINPDEINPVVYVIFANDGTKCNLEGGKDEIGEALLKKRVTAPFDILLSFSGAVTPDSSIDNRITTVSFNKLILVFELEGNGEYKKITSEGARWYTDSIERGEVGVTVDDQTESSTPDGMNGRSNIVSLNLKVLLEAIAHPEQMGYASSYWGGLCCSTGQTATIGVKSVEPCDSVMGPCWLPHTTFYPLVEVGRTPLDRVPSYQMVLPDDDIALRNDVLGSGIFDRNVGEKKSEEMVGSPIELLDLPKNADAKVDTMAPGYCNSFILQDACIYPVVGEERWGHIAAFWAMHKKSTKKFRF